MRRALTVLTICAAAATFAACGDDGGDGGTASSGSGGGSAGETKKTAQDAALDFARCMREQGIDMPDPQVNEDGGMVQMRVGKPGEGPKTDGSDAKFQAANEKCRPLLEGAVREISPEQREEMEDKMLKLARCMRGEGVDFPDPQPGQGLRITPEIANQPGFQAAQEKCHEQAGLEQPGGVPAAEAER